MRTGVWRGRPTPWASTAWFSTRRLRVAAWALFHHCHLHTLQHLRPLEAGSTGRRPEFCPPLTLLCKAISRGADLLLRWEELSSRSPVGAHGSSTCLEAPFCHPGLGHMEECAKTPPATCSAWTGTVALAKEQELPLRVPERTAGEAALHGSLHTELGGQGQPTRVLWHAMP